MSVGALANPDVLVSFRCRKRDLQEGKMLRTIEAVIEPDGHVRLLEPLALTTAHRALVTVLEESDDEAGANITALLSEQALAEWNSDEEDAAWAHFQQEP